MKAPGFTARASLYYSTNYYARAGSGGFSRSGHGVSPQQAVPGWLGWPLPVALGGAAFVDFLLWPRNWADRCVYGNWCGPWCGRGDPIDGVDACCREHDACCMSPDRGRGNPTDCSCAREFLNCLAPFRNLGTPRGRAASYMWLVFSAVEATCPPPPAQGAVMPDVPDVPDAGVSTVPDGCPEGERCCWRASRGMCGLCLPRDKKCPPRPRKVKPHAPGPEQDDGYL